MRNLEDPISVEAAQDKVLGPTAIDLKLSRFSVLILALTACNYETSQPINPREPIVQVAVEPDIYERLRKEMDERAKKLKAEPKNLEAMHLELNGLERYMAEYEEWPEAMKADISKETILKRLNAKKGKYLKLAEKMDGGAILFGADLLGNPLFADLKSSEFGKDYTESRKTVIAQGYELFPCPEEYGSSPHEIPTWDILTLQKFSGGHIGTTWLESGTGGMVCFVDGLGYFNVSDPSITGRKVRRLLRAKK
jgi:hypothetical protein